MPTVQSVTTTHPPAVAAPPAPPALVVVPDAPKAPSSVAEQLGVLPAEWMQIDGVRIGAHTIDSVVVGPNGLFAVHIDPDLRPAAIRPGVGLFRAGARRPDPVKGALNGTAALRERLIDLPGSPFPYPVLVTMTPGESGHRLGRLLVVRPGRLAEVIWSHPSRPLLRSRRAAIRAALQSDTA